MPLGISPYAKSQFATTSPEEQQAQEMLGAAQERFGPAREQVWQTAQQQAAARLAAAERYGTEAEQMRTAAQQQLGAGITQTRSDLMAGAGARGLSPALGRAAGYAGGALQQRGVGMARALQARELAAAEAARQQAMAEQAGLRMGMAEQILGQRAAEQGSYEAMQALASRQAIAGTQQTGQYMAAGIGAGGALGAMAAAQYSDRDLKVGAKAPLSSQEAALIEALRAEGQRTEGALEAATGRQTTAGRMTDTKALQLSQQLGAGGLPAGMPTRVQTPAAQPLPPGLGGAPQQQATLGALSGAGRAYRYTPQAQQQLGQPSGLQYGPMAQDLAQTELGRSAVVPTPAGLAVDTGRLSMIEAGLIGQQEERLRAIEQQLGSGALPGMPSRVQTPAAQPLPPGLTGGGR